MTTSKPASCVFIAALSSDIGRELASMYLAAGCSVVGTYRNEAGLAGLPRDDRLLPIHCDRSVPAQFAGIGHALREKGLRWDLFISAVGQLAPIGKFFDLDMEAWSESVNLNSVRQLQLLHAIFPDRDASARSKVVFPAMRARARKSCFWSAGA